MVTVLRVPLAAFSSLLGVLLVLPVAVISLIFLVVSQLTRGIARMLEPQFLAWHEVIEFDPDIGWKPKANLDTHHLADDVFHVTTDSQGWRGKMSLTESQIVVIGDSFAWGHGIDDKGFFAHQEKNLLIKSIGANGFNMVQELLWLQRLSSQLKDKLVVWFVYFGNDLYENLAPDMHGYRTPFVRELNGCNSWQIVTSHISPRKWPFALRTRFGSTNYYDKVAEMCSPNFQSHRAYSACEFLIGRGKTICDRVGASMVIMTIPDRMQLDPEGMQHLCSRGADLNSFDPNYPDQKFSEICTRLGVSLVSLKDHVEAYHYKERDGHWNKRGHKKVAKVLSDVYRQYQGGVSKNVTKHSNRSHS